MALITSIKHTNTLLLAHTLYVISPFSQLLLLPSRQSPNVRDKKRDRKGNERIDEGGNQRAGSRCKNKGGGKIVCQELWEVEEK